MSMHSVLLWSNGGKVKATLFASRRCAFSVTPSDQTDQLVVHVTERASFNPDLDYLLRVVTKGNRVENQLLAGTAPKWAGGTICAGRVRLADCSACEVFDRVRPVTAEHQREWLERGLPLDGVVIGDPADEVSEQFGS